MLDRDALIWSSGGLALGCMIGACVTKALTSGSFNKKSFTQIQETSMVQNQRRASMESITKFNEQTTTYSQITMLMGSPTPSSIFDTQEYHQYPASTSYPELRGNRTIMARYLTPEVYEELYNTRTSSGYNIDACIQTGIDNPDKYSCGIVAGDEECYELYSALFDPVITDRHRGFVRGKNKIGDITIDQLKSDPFDSKYVKSTHFLVGRCLKGFRFPPSCQRAERKHVETLLKDTLQSLTGEFSGTYLHLSDLSLEQRYHLPDILQTVIDCPTSRTLVSSGSTRDWPSGRGVFYSDDLNFFAWTNREDHLRLMLRDRTSDFIKSYKHFKEGIEQIEERMLDNGIQFASHEHFGFLLTCPSGIGTALRAGVHMKLPNLLRDQRFRTILKNLRLHMGAEDQEMLRKGYVDVYNMDRLGYEECYLVQHVADSVHLLTEMEQRLERKESISDLIVTKDDIDD